MKKIIIIIIVAIILIITLASIGVMHYRAKNEMIIETNKKINDNEKLIISKDILISNLEDEISLEKQIVSQLSSDIDVIGEQLLSLQSQITMLSTENERLYKVIESNDIDSNIEDYFEKVCYLTFDDGPSYLTKNVLKILDTNNIKATFFVNYTSYGDRNNMYKEIVDKGHAIGNHTYSHTKPYRHWEEYFEDMYKMEDFLFERTGQRPSILRFPGGSSNNWNYDQESKEYIDKLHAMGYEFFDWNVSTSDGGSNPLSADDIYNFVISRSSGGKVKKIVVLMHDRGGKSATIEALPDVIEYLKGKGYVFLPLNEDSFAPHIYGID